MGDQISIGNSNLKEIRILIEGEVRQIVEHPITKQTLTLNIEKPTSLMGLNFPLGDNPFVLVSAATDCHFKDKFQ